MTTEAINPPVKEQIDKTEQPAWYDFIIDIFKKLLEYNYSSYGTKKQF